MNTTFYVGPREVKKGRGRTKTIHEVVHVSKSWMCCTLMKAKICKLDVDKVINPWDKVFLGHDLKDWQFSANAREAISARALKCAEKPPIVFDYDHK